MKTARQILEGARERYIPTLGDERGDLILQYERILLPTVKFDFCIASPYSFLKQYAKTIIGDKEQIRQMFQMAWTFVNDRLIKERISFRNIYFVAFLVIVQHYVYNGNQKLLQ